MNLHLFGIFFSVFTICSSLVSAQNRTTNKREGRVIDTSGIPIVGAIISEISTYDNENVNITETDSTGLFKVTTSKRVASLYISCLGYESKTISLSNEDTAPLEVMLVSNHTISLDEVVVVGYKNAVKVEPDKLIYDMSGSPIKEGNTLEAFRFIPLISADDNSFSIVG